MLIPGIDPYLVHIGPIGIRWYGFFMAVSIALGIVWFVRQGRALGVDEDLLYNLSFLGILGGVVGARLVYVVTNLPYFLAFPAEIVRVDHGGLSIHGALLGGAGALWWYASRQRVPTQPLFDWAVPGITVGIALVRIGNIFNQEILGHPAAVLGGARHPAQLYGSAIGVVLLVAYLLQSRRPTPDGYRFWSFFLGYSILRGAVEETFRDNPLYLVHYVNPVYGVGFMTMTQWATIALVPLAAFMRARALRAGRRWVPAGAAADASEPDGGAGDGAPEAPGRLG